VARQRSEAGGTTASLLVPVCGKCNEWPLADNSFSLSQYRRFSVIEFSRIYANCKKKSIGENILHYFNAGFVWLRQQIQHENSAISAAIWLCVH